MQATFWLAIGHATAKVRSVSFRRVGILRKGRLREHPRIQLAQDRSRAGAFCGPSVKLQSVSKRFVFLREARFNRTAPAPVSESAIGKTPNLSVRQTFSPSVSPPSLRLSVINPLASSVTRDSVVPLFHECEPTSSGVVFTRKG